MARLVAGYPVGDKRLISGNVAIDKSPAQPARRSSNAGEPAPAAAAGGRGIKSVMLIEQYRMHPAINHIVSTTFYLNKLKTAPVVAKARQHPLPACFVDLPNGREEFLDGTSCFNRAEAELVVGLVAHHLNYLGFAPEAIEAPVESHDARSLSNEGL